MCVALPAQCLLSVLACILPLTQSPGVYFVLRVSYLEFWSTGALRKFNVNCWCVLLMAYVWVGYTVRLMYIPHAACTPGKRPITAERWKVLLMLCGLDILSYHLLVAVCGNITYWHAFAHTDTDMCHIMQRACRYTHTHLHQQQRHTHSLMQHSMQTQDLCVSKSCFGNLLTDLCGQKLCLYGVCRNTCRLYSQ